MIINNIEKCNNLLNAMGRVAHSIKIKRGYMRQKIVADWFKTSEPQSEVLTEHKVIAENCFKKGEHKVDIIVVDHQEKTVRMYNVKSEGISNTDPKQTSVKTYVNAIEGAKKQWEEYEISYSILRKGGKSIEEYEMVGIKTLNVDKFVGFDIDELTDMMKYQLIKNIEDSVNKLGGEFKKEILTFILQYETDF